LRGRSSVRAAAPVFAALGDATRLVLLARLSAGASLSISELTQRSKLTRQAITKHLRVMEDVGIVRCSRQGRESLFVLDPRSIDAMREYLDGVSRQWDQTLARLKAFVEEEPGA
jgi:DNA-binding transcriptional ArsR family regulator